MKSLICFLAALVLVSSAGFAGEVRAASQLRPGSSTDTCWVTGELNGDSIALTVADVVLGYRIILCEAPASNNLYEVDFNGDCNVDTTDLNLFLDVLNFGPSILPRYPVPTCCNPTLTVFPAAAKGDLNTDGSLTSADAVLILSCIFSGTDYCSFCQADLNCDYGLTPADVVQELNYVFLGTPLAGCP